MKSKILYLEIIAAAIACVGAIYADKPMLPSVLYMVVLVSYAIVCYFISMAYPKPQNPKEKIEYFIHYLSWMGLSITSVGIYFSIQHFPGGRLMLIVGLISDAIALIYHLVNIGKDKDEDEKQEYTVHSQPTPPPFNPQDGQSTNNYTVGYNSTNTFIYKLLGNIKYNHTEMLLRLGIAILIVVKLLFFTEGLFPEVIPQDMEY